MKRGYRVRMEAVVYACLIVTLTGCGRVAFDGVSAGSASPDGSISDTSAPSNACVTFGPWGAIRRRTDLSDAGSQDWGGEISRDGLRFYWSAHRVGNGDIFVASRPTRSDDFTTVQSVMELNTNLTEDEAALSSDELEIYLTGTFNANLGIYRATRISIGAQFGALQPVTNLVGNTSSGFSGAMLTDDDLTIYFNSRTDAEPEGTLVRSTRPDRSSDFAQGTPLSGLETGALKGYPYLAPDGFIYFETGSPHRQSRSQQLGANSWGVATPVAELNGMAGSTSEDISFTADGLEVFFSSDRDGSNDDIYSATRECLD